MIVHRRFTLRIPGALSVVLSSLLLFCSAHGIADDTATLQLETIRVRIDHEDQAIEEAKSREDQLRLELSTLKQQSQKLSQEERTLRQSLDKLTDELVSQKNAVAQSEARLLKIRETSQKRVVALYMQGPTPQAVPVLFFKTAGNEVDRFAYYLRFLKKFDEKLAAEVHSALVDHESAVELLQGSLDQKQVVQRELAEKQAGVRSRVTRSDEVLKKLAQEVGQRESRMTELRAQMLRLEMVIRSLMSKSETGSEVVPVARTNLPLPSAEIQAFQGFGLGKGAKNLKPPVDGPLVTSFGKQAHKRYRENIMSKGVEFAAPGGTLVGAVTTGQVLFANKMPVFGNVVILDHGSRYYTLYGKLADIVVKVGMTVQSGEAIAVVDARPGDDSSGVYFEIRKNGESIDPLPYLRYRRS